MVEAGLEISLGNTEYLPTKRGVVEDLEIDNHTKIKGQTHLNI